MSIDPAHVLFPSDAPTGSAPPEYFKVQHDAATARLMGANKPAADDVAARMFSNEGQTAKAVDPNADVAKRLFPDDASHFDEKPVAEFFNGFATSAASDGDAERAQALNAASEALIADARKAGTNAADFASALDIVRERQGDLIAPLSAEKMAADFVSTMDAIKAEFGATYESDLSAARAFVRDLEILAPGTIASLEQTGAGSDVRLVRAAIREARRRGYR